MNKQELINKLKKLLTTPSEIEGDDFDNGYDFGIERAILLAEGLDDPVRPPEPEKTTVPQCVADFISSEQRSCSALSEAIDNMEMRDEGEVTGWFYDNSEAFAKAWLYGYEIEKEKLYTVEIPSHGNPNHFVLHKHVDGEVCIDYYLSDNWRDYKCAQLTEAEIKKDHDWAWKYAEEVKEC